ncbi:VanZ family protein [Hymenobacter sp. BRD67]|uniref:VanZ family protein n=1 Tax=Hymenobacter sp. BRD67 TaxID=2675877 RepID=UPI00156581C8|nr:VanZ family protein [Hymenobacter sp. BRD67]QKG53374.1 VanZ family protein [Hymenobacter sp. BRD67]
MKTLTRRFYGRLALAWVAVMLVLTLTPAQDMPRTPEWKLLSFDTAAHAGVFAVLAGLGWLWARCVPRLARYAGGWVLLGCVLFGSLIELLQYLMNMGRHAEWTDLLGDTIGAALVLAGAGLAGRGGRRSALPLAFLLVLPDYAHAQATEPDLARARRTIEELASPKMHGRGYVQQGEHLAAAYLRGRLRQLGLQPLAPDYTQSFTLDVNTFPGELQAQLTGRNPHNLRPGRDFIAAPESGSDKIAREFRAWPLDTLIFTDTAAVRRYTTGLAGMVPGVKATPWVTGYLPNATVMRARDEARLPTLPPNCKNAWRPAAPASFWSPS